MQDQGASKSCSWQGPYSWFIDGHFLDGSLHGRGRWRGIISLSVLLMRATVLLMRSALSWLITSSKRQENLSVFFSHSTKHDTDYFCELMQEGFFSTHQAVFQWKSAEFLINLTLSTWQGNSPIRLPPSHFRCQSQFPLWDLYLWPISCKLRFPWPPQIQLIC